MRTAPLRLVFVGLSLSSSWGNGHATTYRALLRALAERGHEVTFLERDVPWYASHRDLADPDFCRLELYDDVADLSGGHAAIIEDADAVVVGSYVPDGPQAIRRVLDTATGLVCFYDIDTPVTLQALRQGDCSYLSADLVPVFDIYFSFSGGPVLETLRREFGARRAQALHCMVDADRYRPSGETPRWDLGYLGTYSDDRQPALERLLVEPARRLPQCRFVVAGSQYPGDIRWPGNVERIDHVPPADHPAFYGQLRYALNITRADMLATGWSPSVRLFEAAACTTPVITDRWAGVDAFFPPGEAILVADGPEDVVSALESQPGASDRAIADEARRIVLANHTGDHRAAELERALTDAGRIAAPARDHLERISAP